MITFIDNDSAAAGRVRSYSANELNDTLIEAVINLDIRSSVLSWYERVPSHSNPADGPSRGRPATKVAGWGAPLRTRVAAWRICDLVRGSSGGLRR